MPIIHMKLNDEPVEALVQDNRTMLDFLRNNMGLTGAKKGCEEGECGACTILLNGKPEDITMKDHRVFIKSNSEKNISYGEAIWMYEEKHFGKAVIGVGSFAHDGDKDIYVKNEGNYAPAYSFSTGAARVEVDDETGCIDISDFIFAHDCGRPLNLRAVEGQIEGSVLLGLGFAVYEECLFDEKGKMLNPSFRDYRFPTALDMPQIQTIICGEPDEEGPFGAKEAGEGSTAPVGPAIVNAINRATGLKFHDLPVTPEKVWRAIKEKKAAEAAEAANQ